jgi:hypothetical protein
MPRAAESVTETREPMVRCLLLTAALSLGQTDPETPEVPVPPPPPALPTPERWMLMKTLQGTWPGWLLDGSRAQVYGWTQGSVTASSDRDNNLPMGFNYLPNNFLLQQNWLRFERTVVTAGTAEPTFGFRNDWILPGSDYQFTVARGLLDRQLTANNGGPDRYGVDPIQFYAEGYFPTIGRGLDVKVGRFFAQYGVESNAAVDNALWSHSYTMVYDPFTNTGVLTTLKLTDAWSVQNGLVTGSDIFFGPEATPTYVGSAKWAPPGGRDSVLFSVILGTGRFNQERKFHNPEIFDLVYVHTINARLTYTLEALYGFTTNVPEAGGFANWFGKVQYLTYTLTPRLNANARLEFFDDIQGQRTGFRGLYSDVTVGLNFRLRPDIILRPEIRYDYNDHSRPFENHHGLFTAGTDLILRW